MNGSDLPRDMPYRWRDDAACAGMDPNLWHPEDRRGGEAHRGGGTPLNEWRAAAAKAVCARCPVGDECEAEGDALGDRLSIRNGKTAAERNPPHPDDTDDTIAHGTPTGYRQHYRRGSRPCDACRLAHAEARVRTKVGAA